MTGVIHKYVRRAILWASKPGHEELAERDVYSRELRRAVRLQRALVLVRRHDADFTEFEGLRAEDAINLISDLNKQEKIQYLDPGAYYRLSVILTQAAEMVDEGTRKRLFAAAAGERAA